MFRKIGHQCGAYRVHGQNSCIIIMGQFLTAFIVQARHYPMCNDIDRGDHHCQKKKEYD